MSSREDFQDLSQVRHVEAGDPVAETTTAQPTRALELRLNRIQELLLQSRSSTETGKFIIRDVDILTGEGGVSLLDAVFYNANTGLYEPAIATVTAMTDGFLSNPTAFSFGIVVAVRSAKADVMVGGYDTWVSEEHKQAMMESTETYRPGVPYFLSATEPGKLTRFAPTLRVQVMLGTDNHFVLGFAWATPESIENIYVVPVGMRPVGSPRLIGPDYEHGIIVGFDALEFYDTATKAWRSTRDSTVATLRQFGYLIADAEVALQPDRPVYVAIEVATNGTINVYSADKLVDLYSGGPLTYNPSSSLVALTDGSQNTLRNYPVIDTAARALGTLKFRFVDDDRSFPRRAVFKFPDDFQGWKMVHAPITPRVTPIVVGGQVTGIEVVEASVGYQTAPKVVITDPDGSGAAATAILDEWGSISEIRMDSFGSGYTDPVVTFDTQLTALKVMNGGGGALATATVDGGAITGATLDDGGTGYLSDPDVVIVDTDGSGSGAVLLALARNGRVVEFKVVSQGSGYVNPVLQIRPKHNMGYEKTVPGTFTVEVTGDAVTGVSVDNGGFNYPPGAKVSFVGAGAGAEATIVVDANGTITAINVISGGTGYDSDTVAIIDEKTPKLFVAGGDPASIAEGRVNLSTMRLDGVEVISEGIAYATSVTITPTGGLAPGGEAAELAVELDGLGRIKAVKVTSPGHGYRSNPDLVITLGVDGNGAVLRPILGAEIISADLLNPGSAYQAKPTAAAGVPIRAIEMEDGGLGYNTPPTVTIAPPDDPNGTQATADAILGGSIAVVTVVSGGAGYIDPDNTSIEVTGGGGFGAVLQPIFSGDVLVDVQVIDPGYGYTSTPLVVLLASNGAGALLSALVEGQNTVVKLLLRCPGSGYVTPPAITIESSGSRGARAQARLYGGTADIVPELAGDGGLRLGQEDAMTLGNRLQFSDFHDDLDDGEIPFSAPLNTAFYYNLKADPRLQARYPAIPVEKASFILNGVELPTSPFSESQRTARDLEADLILARKSIFWPGMDADGSPWDREFLHYVFDPESGGRDQIIPKTGFDDEPARWWRLWANTFSFESGRNRAWMHINRASRFFKSGKVVSIGVLSPLKAIDLVSGVDARNDGSPISGQVLLTLDNQTNVLSAASEQIDLTTIGDLKPIYVNNTGRMVLISSVMVNVVFQLNEAGSTPTAEHSAQVTVGTQGSGYRDIMGSGEAGAVPLRLHAINQAKELLPDEANAAPLIAPNQKVYLRVVLPAGGPILKQLAVARVKGHVI